MLGTSLFPNDWLDDDFQYLYKNHIFSDKTIAYLKIVVNGDVLFVFDYLLLLQNVLLNLNLQNASLPLFYQYLTN